MFGVGNYKTKDGQDVEIVAVVKGVAIGYFPAEESDVVEVNTWSAHTGRYLFESSKESVYDLIDPNAKKPIKQELWVTVYNRHSGDGVYVGGGYVAKEEADGMRCNGCIAIAKVTIDCMEGDNLD